MTCSVLLDLDGTLVDSLPGILASCLAALRALGHEPDDTLDIRRAIGSPLEDIMQVLLRPYGDDRTGEAVAAYLGVLWGYGTRDELETAGADRLADSSADLACTVVSMIDGK